MNLLCLGLFIAAVTAKVWYKETFDDSYTSRWVESSWKKSSGEAGKWGHSAGPWWGGDKDAAKGLETTQDAKFYAISSKFPQHFSNEGKDLVIQFSVKFPQKLIVVVVISKLLALISIKANSVAIALTTSCLAQIFAAIQPRKSM